MADCIDCGKNIGFLNRGTHGRCDVCTNAHFLGRLQESKTDEVAIRLREEALEKEKIETILLTTETGSNLKIIKRIEIVTAEVAYGMNIFKDLFASVRDVVGGRSEAVQKTMRDARRTALFELKREAHSVGANAVVGVDLDYVELSSGLSMVMLVASGTAVVIED